MQILDPGHLYTLKHLDGDSVEYLRFVKREGPGFPGNVGHYEGTNLQEVIRVLIDRLRYLNNQIPHERNTYCIMDLQDCLYGLEARAAERHGLEKEFKKFRASLIETYPTCDHCGHIVCERMNAKT
jgi:hypothetical protein